MLQMIDLRDQDPDDYTALLPRGHFDIGQALAQVEPICQAVAEEGEAALRRFSQRFDGVVPPSLRVDPALARQAAQDLPPDLRQALEVAIDRRRRVAQVEADRPDRRVELAPGATVTIRHAPVGRVGLYVPGGLAPLASSVIMNVVPAQAAGVASIALASPPQADHGGWPHPTILATCHLLGVDEIYAVGGAQAIAMLALGVPGLCRGVDLVCGPGNVYVAAAKRALRGRVGIDAEAGPTEIAILADHTARPELVAADLLSQAEHDPMAGAVLVTDRPELAERVELALADLVESARHHERVRQALSGPQSGVVLVRDLEQGLAVVNAYAAEHLEIMTAQADRVAAGVVNAGAIFIGPSAPVSLGDYAAGSTHVLPTGGAARHSSGLTVDSFLRTVHVIDYDAAALAQVGPAVERIAQAEDLPAHAGAVTVRLAAERGGDR
ncbi:MAG: histidinol dehydrogenase [Propionibacteriaceae bacterium]|nr:histidinol dehydrogenase [Propionibacteriaceae bacterium]